MNREPDRTLTARAARTRLLVAEFVQQEDTNQAAERAEQVLRRVGNATTAVNGQREFLRRLAEAGVVPPPMPAKFVQSARKARTAFRTTATKLKDPSNDLRDLLGTKSINEAVANTEGIIERRNRAIESAFTDFRDRCRPEDIDEVQADGLEPLSLATKVRRLQAVLGSRALVPVGQVIVETEKFRKALREWEDARPEIEAARKRVPAALEAFFRQAQNGVVWGRLNNEVREWLDTGSNGDDYVVIRHDRLN
jgi:hypothetical protein